VIPALPYVNDYFTTGMDGASTDPNGGWKGRAYGRPMLPDDVPPRAPVRDLPQGRALPAPSRPARQLAQRRQFWPVLKFVGGRRFLTDGRPDLRYLVNSSKSGPSGQFEPLRLLLVKMWTFNQGLGRVPPSLPWRVFSGPAWAAFRAGRCGAPRSPQPGWPRTRTETTPTLSRRGQPGASRPFDLLQLKDGCSYVLCLARTYSKPRR